MYNISILTEIPEDLHKSLKHYLDDHPTWDQDSVFRAALSQFLGQNDHIIADNSVIEQSANRNAWRNFVVTS